MLFKYGLHCTACGQLDTKFTTKEFAIRGGNKHVEAYTRVFQETHHQVKVISLEGKIKQD
jgi:hypothetical protein